MIRLDTRAILYANKQQKGRFCEERLVSDAKSTKRAPIQAVYVPTLVASMAVVVI